MSRLQARISVSFPVRLRRSSVCSRATGHARVRSSSRSSSYNTRLDRSLKIQRNFHWSLGLEQLRDKHVRHLVVHLLPEPGRDSFVSTQSLATGLSPRRVSRLKNENVTSRAALPRGALFRIDSSRLRRMCSRMRSFSRRESTSIWPSPEKPRSIVESAPTSSFRLFLSARSRDFVPSKPRSRKIIRGFLCKLGTHLSIDEPPRRGVKDERRNTRAGAISHTHETLSRRDARDDDDDKFSCVIRSRPCAYTVIHDSVSFRTRVDDGDFPSKACRNKYLFARGIGRGARAAVNHRHAHRPARQSTQKRNRARADSLLLEIFLTLSTCDARKAKNGATGQPHGRRGVRDWLRVGVTPPRVNLRRGTMMSARADVSTRAWREHPTDPYSETRLDSPRVRDRSCQSARRGGAAHWAASRER